MKAKNGISLIVLVITIVVIIILAAAVILSLGNNNPINSSKVAKLTQSKDNIESAMSIYISSQWAKTAAEVDTDAATLLTATSASVTSPICSTADALTAETKTASDVATGVAYKITDEGWAALNVTKPSEGSAWYYAPATGKVYVKMTAVPDYAKDNDTVKGFVVTAE